MNEGIVNGNGVDRSDMIEGLSKMRRELSLSPSTVLSLPPRAFCIKIYLLIHFSTTYLAYSLSLTHTHTFTHTFTLSISLYLSIALAFSFHILVHLSHRRIQLFYPYSQGGSKDPILDPRRMRRILAGLLKDLLLTTTKIHTSTLVSYICTYVFWVSSS